MSIDLTLNIKSKDDVEDALKRLSAIKQTIENDTVIWEGYVIDEALQSTIYLRVYTSGLVEYVGTGSTVYNAKHISLAKAELRAGGFKWNDYSLRWEKKYNEADVKVIYMENAGKRRVLDIGVYEYYYEGQWRPINSQSTLLSDLKQKVADLGYEWCSTTKRYVKQPSVIWEGVIGYFEGVYFEAKRRLLDNGSVQYYSLLSRDWRKEENPTLVSLVKFSARIAGVYKFND
jgi:hypothetical protein